MKKFITFLWLVIFSTSLIFAADTKDININKKDFEHETAVHDAVRNSSIEMLEFLIEKKANINIKDEFGYTPLHLAVRFNDTNSTNMLIDNGAKINTEDIYEDTPLLDSIRNNNTEISKILICNNANRNVVDKHGMSALHYASKNNNLYLAKLLTVGDVNIYCQNKIEITINNENRYENMQANICGTIKHADAKKVELSIYSSEDENTTIGTYSAILDNENRSWCAKVEDNLTEGEYNIKAIGEDENKNISTASAKINIEVKNIIEIDKVNVYNDNTPEICGRIIKGDIENIELSLKSQDGFETQPFVGTVYTQDNTWCVAVTDELENGEYEIFAKASDKQGNSAEDIENTKIYLIVGLYEALNTEFKDDFNKWNAALDKDTLTFRFKDPSLLFNPGKSIVNKKFEVILSDFFPRYVKIIQEYKDEIKNVRVEGHSSSEHSRAKNDEERFELNRQLSQKRAEAVMDYASTIDNKMIVDNQIWIDSIFKPIGMSYSKMIFNLDGSENKELSRRVEFRIETKNIEENLEQ